MLRIAIGVVILVAVMPGVAGAQRSSEVTVAVTSNLRADSTTVAPTITVSPRPRWMKGAVIGAVGGGATFAALHWLLGDYAGNSMGRDVLTGVMLGGISGGVMIGLYDWVCAPNSASDRAGLCSSLYNRQTRASDSSRVPMMRVP